MRKVAGHRLMLVGIYLFIGLVLTVVGRVQVSAKKPLALSKKSTLNQQIVSALRHLMTSDVTGTVLK